MAINLASPLVVEVCWDGVVATVTVSGELDMTNAPDLAKRLENVANAHPERLVLDLAGLVFVDVAGARALHRAHKALQAECPVVFRRPRPCVCRVFQITGLMGGLGGYLLGHEKVM